MKSVGRTKLRFSPDIMRPVLERNRADITWMEQRLGQSLSEELGEHQPGDIRDEQDLLRPDPAAVGRLLQLLGGTAPKGVKGKTPEEVALLVHALSKERSPWRPTVGWAKRASQQNKLETVESRPLKVPASELIEEMQQAYPGLPGGIARAEAQ